MILADAAICIDSWWTVLLLICSGLLVGFINTLAGGGTIISISVFMLLGMPAALANGTNRIAIILQNMTAVYNFRKNKILDLSKTWKLSIPIIVGSIIGAIFANHTSNNIFNIAFGFVAIIIGIALLVNPQKWLKENPEVINKPFKIWHYTLFFLIGLYGGFIHVGVGYFLITAIVFGTGHDLLRSNALKNFFVLAYVPFSLIVFAIDGNVNWTFGLIHSIGNILGAEIASHLALKKGNPLIRYMMIIVVIIIVLQLFGIIDTQSISIFIQNL